MVADFVFDDLAKQERQQLFRVLSASDVFAERLKRRNQRVLMSYEKQTYPFKLLLDRHLLSADERVNGCADGQINVAASNVFSQVHASTSFRHADH